MSCLRWYWLLEPEALLVIAMTALISLVLAFPRWPELQLAAALCSAVAVCVASLYRYRVHKRIGAGRVKAPMGLTVSLWVLLLVEVVSAIMYLILT
jgi:hypothetical protein